MTKYNFPRVTFYSVFPLSIAFCLLMAGPLSAQQVDFDKVITAAESRPDNFIDYLVQLAWKNNPQSQIIFNQREIAGYEVDLSRQEWMDNISIQFNLNEISLSNLIYNYEDPLFIAQPLWNFTASVNLGTFFNRPKKIQIAKEKQKITDHNVSLLKLRIRAEVMSRYQEYLLAIEVLKVRQQAEEEAYQNSKFVADLFKQDKADFEILSNALVVYSNAQEARLRAAADIKLEKYRIEELIGVTLEEANKFGASYKKKEETED